MTEKQPTQSDSRQYVIFSTQIWTDNWVSKHWIAHWLAELGHEVYFVEPFRAVFPRRGGRIRDMFSGPALRTVGNVRVVSFSSLPAYHRMPGILKPLWRRAMKPQFRRFSKLLAGKKFDLLTFDGRSLPLLDLLPKARRTAYYCVDPVGAGEDKRFPESKLVESVERVIAISSACRAALMRDTGRGDIQVIPHGIDFKATAKSSSVAQTARPADLPPADALIGYTGSIHDIYVDFPKIVRAATEHPDWTFVFIGPYQGSDIAQDASARIRELLRLPNVRFLGSKPYQELGRYIKEFDVCLIPYRADIDNGWERRSPVKVLHYLCAGKPVVCADVPGISAYKEVIRTYRDYPEFIECIRSALSEKDDDQAIKDRIELASSRDCDIVIQELISALE